MTMTIQRTLVGALLGVVLASLFLVGGSAHAAGAPRDAFLTGADLSELPYREGQGFRYYEAGT